MVKIKWDYVFDVVSSIIFLIVVFGVIALVAYGIGFYVDNLIDARHKAQLVCIENGYPDLLTTENGYYCHKLENGNDVIVSVESLRDGR